MKTYLPLWFKALILIILLSRTVHADQTTITGLDVTGSEQWSVDIDESFVFLAGADESHVYTATENNHGYCDIGQWDSDGDFKGMSLAGSCLTAVQVTEDRIFLLDSVYYSTIWSFDRNGNEIWSEQIVNSTAKTMAPGLDGELYVVVDDNVSYVLRKFDANGQNLWSQSFEHGSVGVNRPAMVVTDSGGVIVAAELDSNGDHDIATVVTCFDADGEMNWQQAFTKLGGTDGPTLAQDAVGNVFVANRCGGETGCLVKLDAQGERLWRVEYEQNDLFEPVVLTVCPHGRVTVGINSWDWIDVNSYGPRGTYLWGYRIKQSEVGNDIATSIAADLDGNTYLAGRLCDELGYDGVCARGRYFVTMFDQDGKEGWLLDRWPSEELKSLTEVDAAVVLLTGGFRDAEIALSPDLLPDTTPDDDTFVDDDTSDDDDQSSSADDSDSAGCGC